MERTSFIKIASWIPPGTWRQGGHSWSRFHIDQAGRTGNAEGGVWGKGVLVTVLSLS